METFSVLFRIRTSTNLQCYDLLFWCSLFSQFGTRFYLACLYLELKQFLIGCRLLIINYLELLSSRAIITFLLSAPDKGISLKRLTTNMPLLHAKMLLTLCNSSSKEVGNKPICFRVVYKNQQISSRSNKIHDECKISSCSVQIISANVVRGWSTAQDN